MDQGSSPLLGIEGLHVVDVRLDAVGRRVHAEQNAILDALRHHPTKVAGSRLYFIRPDELGRPALAGSQYCTICQLTQAAGMAAFILLHPGGITVYDADEYNRLSFRHADRGPATRPSDR